MCVIPTLKRLSEEGGDLVRGQPGLYSQILLNKQTNKQKTKKGYLSGRALD
jgi:hypothetical protein